MSSERRPIQGFLANRLQHAMMHEALYMIQDGYCTVEEVDDFCRISRMSGIVPRTMKKTRRPAASVSNHS